MTSKKDKTHWGANGMITFEDPAPALESILQQAQAASSIQWLRWEMVEGKQTAVYSFNVPPANSELAVDVCCFPQSIQTGRANFYNSTDASIVAGSDAMPGSAGGAVGNFQTNTLYDQRFKATVPFHGEIFVDPASGIIRRLITQPEFKASENVQQDDTRIDYGPVKFGGKVYLLPIRTVVNSIVVPGGDSGAARFATRRTLFISEFKY